MTNTDSDVKIIRIINGQFTCTECENTSEPQTNTVEGIVDADLEKIKAELEQFPTKVTYAICRVCGMEYIFRIVDGELVLEESVELK